MKEPTDPPLNDRDLQFLQMGRASMIPGFQKAIDILQEQLNLMKTEMYAIQDLMKQRVTPSVAAALAESRQLEAPALRSRGRPKKDRAAASKGYWASLSPEERSAEMMRRRAKGQGTRPKSRHPREKDHPKHAEWLAKISKARRKQWDGYSPRERKRRIKALVQAKASKRRAGTPSVTLEKIA